MPHFFINSKQVVNNIVEVSDKENYQHIAKSLRARVGETLLLIDENQIQYETTISEITNSKVVANIDKYYLSKRFLDFELYLAQSPLRSDAQGLIIEKATELGVVGVYPIMTDNCALNKSVVEKKVPKWQRIMYESSKQCERAVVPTCYDATTLEKVLSENSSYSLMQPYGITSFDKIFLRLYATNSVLYSPTLIITPFGLLKLLITAV